jgi:hypothetical protein
VLGCGNMYAQRNTQQRDALNNLGKSLENIGNEIGKAKAAKKKAEAEATSTSGGIAKTAKQTLKIGESYNFKNSTDNFTDFIIVTTEDGSLTLSLETFADGTGVALFNEDGEFIKYVQKNIVSGDVQQIYFGINNSSGKVESTLYNQAYLGNRWSGVSSCLWLKWNTTVEKFKGSFTFKLDAGSYYLRTARSRTGLSTVNLSLDFKDMNDGQVNTGNTEKISPALTEKIANISYLSTYQN